MNQSERRLYLIRRLVDEKPDYRGMKISEDADKQKMLLRALMNIRMPEPADSEFLKIQDEYLQEEIIMKGIVKLKHLTPIMKDIYLWKGDITLLETDAIVNAANSGMTGCYVPNHLCIDNCIHTFSGVQLRLECADLMEKQGHPEPTGSAKITSAYNLPSKYVIHTVGPIVHRELEQRHIDLLKSSYNSCLEIAEKNGLKSIAFCCISTGLFGFPSEEAAKIAVDTVINFKKKHNSDIKVVFNVFKQKDYDIYSKILIKK